jgi:hypothetical protein
VQIAGTRLAAKTKRDIKASRDNRHPFMIAPPFVDQRKDWSFAFIPDVTVRGDRSFSRCARRIAPDP